jgi:PPM family protein phosphatase
MLINYKIESASLIGGRAENQDCYKIAETAYGLLAVVCDGMGGENGGKIAAELAVSKIFEEVSVIRGNSAVDVLMNAISKANETIFKEGRRNPGLFGMGTTVTALLINENHAMSFHVGDSRIYQFRKGKIPFRTFDHSWVFEQVRLGILTEEEARVSPGSNIITRALGIRPDVEIAISDELTYEKGDRFLLCTDGIWGEVPETQLTQMVSIDKPIKEVVEHLIKYIDQQGIEEGEMHDNMTAVMIEMQNNSI